MKNNIENTNKEENKLKPDKSLLNLNSSFTINEAYKAARTNLSFLLTEGNNVACFTSPLPGEGKTTTCANIAITFAQTNASVLIVDVDMRKPTIHKLFGLPSKPGLTNILGGFCEIEDAIKHSIYPNLDILTVGHIPPNPVELIGSSQMSKLIKKLSFQYDYVFLDTPPVNIVTDVTVLSRLVSGVVLVTRQGITTTDSVKHAVENLSFVNANILGFILNDINIDKYDYKYSYRNKGKKQMYSYKYTYSE